MAALHLPGGSGALRALFLDFCLLSVFIVASSVVSTNTTHCLERVSEMTHYVSHHILIHC